MDPPRQLARIAHGARPASLGHVCGLRLPLRYLLRGSGVRLKASALSGHRLLCGESKQQRRRLSAPGMRIYPLSITCACAESADSGRCFAGEIAECGKALDF